MAIALGLAQGAWYFARQLFDNIPTTLPLGSGVRGRRDGPGRACRLRLALLVRLAEVPPVAVFRESMQRRVRRFDVLYLVPLVTAIVLVWVQSDSAKLAGILAASLAGVAVVAALLSALLLVIARRVAPGAHPALRPRPGGACPTAAALSLVQATALSLGLCALLLLAVIAPSLLDGWRRELPVDTPNWFALNLQDDQREEFARALERMGATRTNMMPLAVGKLTAINGKPIDSIAFTDGEAKDSADRQLRLSWSAELRTVEPGGGRRAGRAPRRIRRRYPSTPRGATGSSLKLGDTLSFEVGEGTLDARVGSVREVDWSSFRVNFFLLLDPAHAGELPHTWLTSFYLPRGHADELAKVSREYGNLSLIDVDALLDRVREIVDRGSAARFAGYSGSACSPAHWCSRRHWRRARRNAGRKRLCCAR